MRILDRQDHRTLIRQMLEEGEQLFEQAGAALPVAVRARRDSCRSGQLGQQPGEPGRRRTREQGGDAVGAKMAVQVAQERRERREGQAVRAELQASSGQDPPVGAAGELAHQAGLADTCLAADQDRRGRTVTHPAKRALQLGELAGAAHHSRTADPSSHTRAADAASAYPHIAVNSTDGA